ncbi:MAG: CHAP domain-containing protein [Mangrovibacterium sp.]
MAKGKNWIVFLLLLWCGNCYPGQPLLRQKLIRVAESQVGVLEKTGKNDGAQVEKYLKSVGLGKGYAWCAAFVTWCHDSAGIDNPSSAWSPDWFRSNVVYQSQKKTVVPFTSQPGQVFGLYFETKRRVAHVGMITGEDRLHYTTIEGNTDGSGTREGDGVYRRIRTKKSIYVISDYCE